MSKFGGSKFRHIVGSVQKKELWYPDLKSTAGGGESNSIAASAYWIATAWASAGSVALLQLDQPGKRKSIDVPTIFAHGLELADMCFSPFRDDLLATSADDGVVKLWTIPAGNTSNITNPTVTLSGHKKRVDSIKFHPTANNVLASGSTDKSVRIWDIEAGKDQLIFDGIHGDAIHALDWSWDGSLLATVSKDKKVRILDPRSNSVTQTGEGHQGVKASRVVWLGEFNKIATSGFSKMRERQFAIWDVRDLSKALAMPTIDSSTGVVDLFFDNDSKILTIAGKGDSNIKLVEINETGTPYTELANLPSDVAQKSTTVIPKRATDLMNTEIVRVLKLTSNSVVPVSFSVPRKAKSDFQEDLYPPTKSTDPALTAAEWFAGETKQPSKVQLKPSSNPHKFWEQDYTANTTTTAATTSVPVSSAPAATTTSTATATAPSATESTTTTTSASTTPDATPSSTRSSSNNTPSSSASNTPYVPKTVKVVRSSKFRHISGKGTKMDDCFTNLKITSAANNSVIRANPTFFCVPWVSSSNAGLVAVFPLAKPGRRPDSVPLIECGSGCLDFDWNPFNDYVLATVTESAHLQIWKVPEGGYTKTTTTPDAVLKGHLRRVTSVDFHPTIANIAITSSGDNTIRLWDIEKSSEAVKIDGPSDMVNSLTWSWDGSVMGVSSKDRELRLYDARSTKLISKGIAHDGAKGFKAAWMGRKDQILTVGHNRNSERQLSLWDNRNLSTSLSTLLVDQGSGMMTPFFDPDINVVYLAGKGDGNIKMYEVEEAAPHLHYLTDYGSNVPAQGIAIFPKTTCNVRECEIARFLKLTDNYAEPLSFKVPRTRMEYFQDDLYPPTRKIAPALQSGEWLAGKTKEPEVISLQPSGMKPLSEAPVEQKTKKYEFNPDQPEELTREKVLDRYYQQMGSQKETTGQVLKQDLMEGVDASEWDD